MSGGEIFFLSLVLGAFCSFGLALMGSTMRYHAWLRTEKRNRR